VDVVKVACPYPYLDFWSPDSRRQGRMEAEGKSSNLWVVLHDENGKLVRVRVHAWLSLTKLREWVLRKPATSCQ
jgi:hypothetical protein